MSSTAVFRTEAEAAKAKTKPAGALAVETGFGPVFLDVTGDVGGLEAVWEGLQQVAPCTASQTFDFARAWTRHGLAAQQGKPVIAVGRDADGTPLFLWPFELTSHMGLKVLSWLGQDHANYNFGLFAPGAGEKFDRSALLRLLNAVAEQTGAAAAVLKAQPFAWGGVANPFAKLLHQASPNAGHAVTLGDFEPLFEARFGKRSRSNFLRKERKLAEHGRLAYGWAESHDDKLAIMDAFFAQKSRQFAAMGVRDIFDAHARAFYRELALLEGDSPGRLRLAYLKVGDTVAAIFAGSIGHGRFVVSLSSIADGEVQKQSPGALLLRHLIETACAQGLTFFDIGVGAARHKDQWCDENRPLFDSFIALSLEGTAVTLPLAALARVKRAIKSNPWLWRLAQDWRTKLLSRPA
jgi:CelD/BcsL family acetyltransferase involved in cellulose biosynthesis